MRDTMRLHRARHNIWWLAAVVFIEAAGLGVAWQANTTPPTQVSASSAAASAARPYIRRETRPTLDPARFVGKAAIGHQVARDIPDVLDQLYCYCECDKHAGHKSLYSCYTDGHAAT
jgi:hypothetical protein